MAGLTDAYELTVLDATFTNGDKLILSTDGTNPASNYTPPSITWAAAAAGAKSNSAEVVVTAVGGDIGLVTHFAITTSVPVTMTDWTALDDSRTINEDGTGTFAIGDLTATLD